MPSTYTVNLGIEKPATGEQSGTWGDTTNVNFDIIDQAVNGSERVTLTSAGTSGSPNDLNIVNGSTTSSEGRNKWIEIYSASDLGGSAYVRLVPNDAEKILFIRNSLAGSQSVLLFQGTYNASNDLEIPAGVDMVVKFDGAGASATVTDVFTKLRATEITTPTLTAGTADINGGSVDGATVGAASASTGAFTTLTASTSLNIASSTTVDGVLDEDNMASDSATKLATQQSIKAYVDSQVGTVDTLAEILANGNTSGANNLIIDSGQALTANTINETTAGTGVTIDSVLLKDDVVNATDIETSNISANDGTAAATIANSTGNFTITNFISNSVDIGGGAIDGTNIGASSAATGAFTTFTSNGIDDNATTTAITIDSSENTSFSSANTHAASVNVASFANTTTGEPVAIAFTAVADNGGLGNEGGIYFDAGADGSAANNQLQFNADHQSTVTPDMVITGSGNVGINTTNPNLHGWSKAVTLDTASNAGYELGQSGTKYGAFALQGDGRVQLTNFTANPLTFQTNNAERARIDGSGNFIFNEDSNDQDFRVESNGNTHALFIDGANDTVNIGTSTSNVALLNISGEVNGNILRIGSGNNYESLDFSGTTDYGNGTIAISPTIVPGSGVGNTATYFARNPGTGGGSTNHNVIVDNAFTVNDGAAVFNEDSGDNDFRVESNTDTHALFVDAGNSRVGINSSAPLGLGLTIDGGATAGAYFYGGTNDRRQLVFTSYDTASLDAGHEIKASSTNGRLSFATYLTTHLTLDAADNTTVFNEGSTDQDFRVESDSNTHAFFVDAGNNFNGMYTSTPVAELSVNGSISTTGIYDNAYVFVPYEVPSVSVASNSPRYILLCRTGSSGRILNGTFYGNRSTASSATRSQQYEVQVGVNSVGTINHANFTHRGLSADSNVKLVTLTYDSITYIALKVCDSTSSAYPTGYNFIGTSSSWSDVKAIDDSLASSVSDYTGSTGFTAIKNQNFTTFSGDVTFNEDGENYDFRVESDSSTHALFMDATNGNIGINDSAPSSTLASGISATGRVLSIASGGTTAVSIRSTDSVNDRNAVLEMLSSGNGGSDNIIVFGDTDTTPGSPSGLQLQGYHNGSRVQRWYMDSNAAIYWHKASAGGGWLTAELAKTHLGNDASGTADISFTITFTNSSGTYDNFQVMLYLSLSGNSAPASTSVYEIRGLQRSSAVSIGRTTLVSGESRSITTSTSGLDLTITLASAGSSTATQGAICRVLGAYYGVSKIVSGNS